MAAFNDSLEANSDDQMSVNQCYSKGQVSYTMFGRKERKIKGKKKLKEKKIDLIEKKMFFFFLMLFGM